MNDEIDMELTIAYLARKKKEARKINKDLSSIVIPAETVDVAYQHPQMYRQLLNGEISPTRYWKAMLEKNSVPVASSLLDGASARYEIEGSIKLGEKEGTDPLEYWLFENGQEELLKEIYTPEGYRTKLESWINDLTDDELEQNYPSFTPEEPQVFGPLIHLPIEIDLETKTLKGRRKDRELNRFIERQQRRIFG